MIFVANISSRTQFTIYLVVRKFSYYQIFARFRGAKKIPRTLAFGVNTWGNLN